MNQIATITMVGQWPDGIPLHIDNLRWALSSYKHKSYIVCLPAIKEKYYEEYPDVVFIESHHKNTNQFMNFWKDFPRIAKNIDCEYFLLMEQDILFHDKIQLSHDTKIITNYLPLSKYHAMTLNDKIYHARVWEGANLIHSQIIQKSIEDNISFSFTKQYFFEQERENWEEKLGGKIGMNEFKIPDTMDEMCYYCPLVHNTEAKFVNKAYHFRGPETVHRIFPNVLEEKDDSKASEIQKKISYIDPYLAFAMFYLSGNYTNIENYNVQNMKRENKKFIHSLNREWMNKITSKRLEAIMGCLN